MPAPASPPSTNGAASPSSTAATSSTSSPTRPSPGRSARSGYDDEGVKSQEWDLVKNGILVNYEAIRDQVHILGENASHGCCYADNWSSIQFQRMPNVSLRAGHDPA